MDVADWLAGLGMERYADAFAAHAVDAELLATLTAEDLVGIGVTTVGHRRKLLNAIAALRGERAPQARRSTRRTAERRPLTIMFVDLVDSTGLARRLDPEDMRELIRRYQDGVAGEIGRFAGHVAKFMGDGVLAYFGWPRAHEGEAERAVRAGLAATRLVAGLRGPGGEPLAARVGIASGLVVVGDLIGEGAAQEAAVVGETPNLAARLQSLAPPGVVLVADATRRLLAGRFALTRVDGLEARGFGERVTAWQVGGPAAAARTFRDRASAPMIGREPELALLAERWQLARAGQGQAVLLAGEAGIGKTRLLLALRELAAAEPSLGLHWQGSPFHTDSPLWPLAQEREAGLLAPLDQRLREHGLGAEGRQRTFQALAEHLLAQTCDRPVLLIVEDAHWLDATTLELVRLLLDRLADARLMLVLAGRPEGLPELSDRRHLTRLTLGRLSRAAVAELAAGLLARRGPPAAGLLDAVARRSDGVPLFVEELAKALAERTDALEVGIEVPLSLHDALMSRLDRLAEAKELAQIAACIGREFEHALLAAVADLDEGELLRQLDRLCAAELLFRPGDPPRATYRFKHALVRDVAYESLLRSRRRAVHAGLLAALERGAATAGAEDMARHAAGAEAWAKALHHYGAAARTALERGADAEGLALAAKAIAAGDRLIGDPTAEIAMIDLRRARGWAYLATGDMPRLMAELREAESRAGRLGMTRLSGQLRAQRAHVEAVFGGHARRAVRYGHEAARIATVVGDANLAAMARCALGLALLAAGEHRAAAAGLEADADACRQGLRIAAVGSSGLLAVELLAVLGHALGQLGRWEEALRRGAEARAVAAEAGSGWDMHVANHHLAATLLAKGDAGAALPLIEANLDYGRRSGLRTVTAVHLSLLGHADLLAGRPREALDRLGAAIRDCREMHLSWSCGHALLLRAEACLATGQPDATTAAGVAHEHATAHGYRAFEAAALRLLATSLAADDREAARQHLSAAEAITGKLDLPLEAPLLAALAGRLGAPAEPAIGAG